MARHKLGYNKNPSYNIARKRYTSSSSGGVSKKKKSRHFKTIFDKIKICKRVPVHSREGRSYLKKLHRNQGKKGHVKVPGYRRRYILDQALRREAREGGSAVHRRILRRLNRQSKKRKVPRRRHR